MPVETPAEGAVTTNAEAVVETTPSTTAGTESQPAESAASTPTVEPSPTAAKPDLATILADPEYRKELLKHPDIAKEIEHRASSEAGRRAKAELERFQQQQQREQERARAEALLSMDETELGEIRKQEIAAQLQERAMQERLQPEQERLQLAILRQTGEEVFGSVTALAKEAGATEEELAQLNPANYGSLGEYVKGAIQFMGTREGKKLAKDMAKVQAQELLEAARAADRDGSPAPANWPPGEGRRSYSRADLANMSPEEYRRNRDAIWEQLQPTRR